MKQFVCLASEPWQEVPTRTQQFMVRLRDAQVLYFEPPAEQGNRAYKKPGRRIRPGLTVYTLPPILDVEEEHNYFFRRNLNKLTRFIRTAMERHRFREPLLWCTSPDQVHLLDYLPYRGLVYDCDREWTGFPLRWESDLTLAADVVFAASPGLVDQLSPCNDNIALLPNGANFPMYQAGSLTPPPELLGRDRPVLGYAGTIWRDLDLIPLLQAVDDHPDCAFVLLGRLENNPLIPQLRIRRNVAFLGYRTPAELPGYLSCFDVCLGLLRVRHRWNDVLPPRIYEYLSTGNPIVTMLYEDQVETFPDVVYAAHTAREFSRLCDCALSEVGDWARQRRQGYGAANAWSCQADEVARILETIGFY